MHNLSCCYFKLFYTYKNSIILCKVIYFNNVLYLTLLRSVSPRCRRQMCLCLRLLLPIHTRPANIPTNESTGFHKQALWLARAVRRRDLSTQVTVEPSTRIYQVAEIRAKKRKLVDFAFKIKNIKLIKMPLLDNVYNIVSVFMEVYRWFLYLCQHHTKQLSEACI